MSPHISDAPCSDGTSRLTDTEHSSLYGSANPQSARLFRGLAVIALSGHTLILIATAFAGIIPLVIINVVSVLLYVTAVVLNARRAYIVVLGIGLIEVTVHAVAATAILGWASGFHIYVLALVPLIFFYDPWRLNVRAGVSCLIVVFYVALAWFAHEYFENDSRAFVDWFRYGNLFVGSMVLSALSYYYGTAFLAAQRDLEIKNAQLDELARTDHLTGLPNRREAKSRMDEERIRSARSKAPFAIALIDIDHFKRVNDEHGHDCGDEVLRSLAILLTDSLRGPDIVSRWGGEEFLLLLPETDREGAFVVAERLRAAVTGFECNCSGARIKITVTIGVEVQQPADDIEKVVKRADQALYTGKQAGRNKVVCSWDNP